MTAPDTIFGSPAQPAPAASPTEPRPNSGHPAVRVEGLGKDFRHPWTQRVKTAVHEVSFDVPEGGVFGLLGPNGAGKTTTLRLLLGLLPATRGQAWLLGRPAGTPASREDVGFLPENPYFFDHLTGLEFLEFSGELAGLSRPAARQQARTLVERVGSGLDPIGRREVVDLVRELKTQGTTVVFSSHILHDVEVLCDRVAILRAGRLLAAGTLEHLLEQGDGGAEIVVRARGALALPPEFLGVAIEPVGARTRIVIDDPGRAPALVAWLAGHGHEVLQLTPVRRSLEDLFMHMFEGAHEVGGDAEHVPARAARRVG